jgi:hypothetical protein
MLESLLMVKLLAGTLPKKTPVAVVNDEPEIVTFVAPPVLPLEVPRLFTTGAGAVV